MDLSKVVQEEFDKIVQQITSTKNFEKIDILINGIQKNFQNSKNF